MAVDGTVNMLGFVRDDVSELVVESVCYGFVSGKGFVFEGDSAV